MLRNDDDANDDDNDGTLLLFDQVLFRKSVIML